MTDLENFRGDSRKSVLKFEGKRRWRVLSNVVRIRQDQETLQTIDLSFLKEWLMRQQLYFGVLNEAYALENYEKTDADIRGIRFVIFDRQCFGRGFQLLVEEDYDLELTLNAFATERDVQSFFLGIRDLCETLAVDEFEQEGERCFLDQIDALYKESIKQNRWLVKHRLQERTTIFGCIYPIMIEESLIRHLALLEEPAAYRLYERYLDERSLRQLKRQPPEDFSEMVIAALTVGCLRLNAVLYRSDETLIQGYDVLVKDDPSSPEWIFYDGISDTASPKEVEMLRILDGAARRHGLSYTESCFTRLDGKVPRKPKPRP